MYRIFRSQYRNEYGQNDKEYLYNHENDNVLQKEGISNFLTIKIPQP